jgi:hypothetical protein
VQEPIWHIRRAALQPTPRLRISKPKAAGKHVEFLYFRPEPAIPDEARK